MSKVETIEEFLAKGGEIKKVKDGEYSIMTCEKCEVKKEYKVLHSKDFESNDYYYRRAIVVDRNGNQWNQKICPECISNFGKKGARGKC